MPENRSRFVLLCQQSLAFGLVAAVAAPAANMVTLEIVAPHQQRVTESALPTVDDGSAAPGAGDAPSLVASKPVKPRVTDVPLAGVSATGLKVLREGTAATRGDSGSAALVSAEGDPETDDLAVLSAPQPVDSLATVGVTWEHGENLPDSAIKISVRTQKDGAWSRWQTMPYHDEHGPDPSSAEARRSRPGTDPVYVGNVDDVQVKAVTDSGKAPDGMQLSLVDPGAQSDPTVEKPAIDTGTLDLSAADTTTGTSGSTDPTDGTTTDGTTTDGVEGAELSAGVVTAKPMIYSRAQWGADERLRDKSSLHYGEVHAGFVHHTVNANTYTAAQVPAIIRGIYAYHTQSKGWSDVGYNFLVDRFGRIWEGRYGGVDRPVVGAHTLGYNDDAFAMSAIGNFETAQPSSAMLDAYGRLFAWKLSLHGVSAGSMKQWVTKRYLPAINGHRDVGQTACPGKYLYAKIPTIRSLAVKYQRSFASRNRTANLGGTSWPDLVVRDKATKRGYVLRTGGQVGFSTGRLMSSGWAAMDLVAPVGDVTGDGRADLLARNKTSHSTGVYPGDGAGQYAAPVKATSLFAGVDQMAGVGDWNGDGRRDVVGRVAATKKLYLYPGDGRGGFAAGRLMSSSWGANVATAGTGDVSGDGRPDLVVTTTDGRLILVTGKTTGIATIRQISSGWGGTELLSGADDLNNDGRTDLLARDKTSHAAYVYPGNGAGRYGTRIGPFTTTGASGPVFSAGQVSGSAAADLVGRDAAGNLRVFVNNGAKNVEALSDSGQTFPSANLLLNAGDWNGDARGDVISRSARTGVLYLFKGTSTGRLGAAVKMSTSSFGAVRLLTPVGDVTGDGYPDLMGQPSGGSMRIYPSNGGSGFRTSYVSHAAISATQQAGIGLWDADGSPDSLFRRSDGKLVLYPGNGPGGLTGGTVIGSVASGYDWLLAMGDVSGDRRQDLLAREATTGRLWLLPGTSSSFGARRLVVDGMGRFDLAG